MQGQVDWQIGLEDLGQTTTASGNNSSEGNQDGYQLYQGGTSQGSALGKDIDAWPNPHPQLNRNAGPSTYAGYQTVRAGLPSTGVVLDLTGSSGMGGLHGNEEIGASDLHQHTAHVRRCSSVRRSRH
jgi:hypothetical protein